MRISLTKLKVLIAIGLIILLCFWIYGWGGKDINVMDFNADVVSHIEINGQLDGRFCTVTVSEKEDIQAIIDTVNSFRHSGNDLKYIIKYGIGAGLGGTALYEFCVYFLNGGTYTVCFGLNGGDQDLSDMEVGYWIPDTDRKSLLSIPSTCKGSMELIFSLLEESGVFQ